MRALLESYVSHGDVVVEDVTEFYERFTGKLALEWLTPTRVIASGKFRPSRRQQATRATAEPAGRAGGARRAGAAAGRDCDRHQARFARSGVVRPPARQPARPALHAAEIPDDAGWPRQAVRVGRRQPRSRDAGRQVAAAVPARRAAAIRQHPQGRDEPGRTAAAPGVESRAVHARGPQSERGGGRGDGLLRAAADRAAGPDRLGPGALPLRQQPRRRDRKAPLRPLLRQAHVGVARSPHHDRDRRA